MKTNFSSINPREQPTLILRNLDGTPIGTVSNAFNVKATLCFNEISEFTFDVPAHSHGEETAHYQDVTGMRILDVDGIGQFVLVNPAVKNDGVSEIKSCKAYSLEYEFTYKKLSLPSDTYNLYNPITPANTILGIILEKMPSWSVGTVDSTLVGKYRTFEISDENLYNFMKSTLQQTYCCIFDFDTYHRKINVIDVSSSVGTKPVYISLDNLAKEIQLTEDTEGIFTCLDVNGSDDVTIRSVNPLGTNKIYNLDYFMVPENFPAGSDLVAIYNTWKNTVSANQSLYFELSVAHSAAVAEKLTEEAKLVDLQAERDLLETELSVMVQANAEKISKTDTREINDKIDKKRLEILAKREQIADLEASIEKLAGQLSAINDLCSLEKAFGDKYPLLDRYIKEDAISESSFAAAQVKSYTTADTTKILSRATFTIKDSEITTLTTDTDKTLYSVRGGTLVAQLTPTSGGASSQLESAVVRAVLEQKHGKQTGQFLFTAHLSDGSILDSTGTILSEHASGNVSMTGTITSASVNGDNSQLTFATGEGTFYFTQNVTEYQRRSVEWDLLEYGQDCLSKLAYPAYTFSVSCANFLALDDFQDFHSQLALGQKLCLQLNDSTLLQPILVKVELDFEDITNFILGFGDKYTASDSEFYLADLLDQSISMGKTVDLSKLTYSSFVDSGASNAVKDFMDSALDVAKNAVLSSKNQAISWSEAGLRLRKWESRETEEYSEKQIWMINNSIVFTDDNWRTACMAIGNFVDDALGDCWGIVAPNIVGTLLAGQSLYIHSTSPNGYDDKMYFKMDSDGLELFNANFEIYDKYLDYQISLNPNEGIIMGNQPLYKDGKINRDKVAFSVDMDGNLFVKGIVQANDFLNSDGDSILADGDKYQIDWPYLQLKGLVIERDEPDGTTTVTLEIDVDGNIWMMGTLDSSEINSSTINGGDIYGTNIYGSIFRAIHNDGIEFHNAPSWEALNENTLVGGIKYDEEGLGTSTDHDERMWVYTKNNYALKLESSHNMSLAAGRIPRTDTFLNSVFIQNPYCLNRIRLSGELNEENKQMDEDYGTPYLNVHRKVTFVSGSELIINGAVTVNGTITTTDPNKSFVYARFA